MKVVAGTLQRRKAREQGRRVARAHSNGAVTFVQRFNSALELSLHFHMHAHGRLLDDGSDEEAEPQLMFAGRAAARTRPEHEEALPARCARQDGYSLHAGRRVHENDGVGLEELARYGQRPALSQERLREAVDGAVLYEMKRRFSDGRQMCGLRRGSCCCGCARWCRRVDFTW